MPRVVFPFHIIDTEYVPAWTVPVVNSIQLPAFSASSEIHLPPLEFASVCVEWPVPLSVTARLSASNETVVPVPPPPMLLGQLLAAVSVTQKSAKRTCSSFLVESLERYTPHLPRLMLAPDRHMSIALLL